jgi:hypothetical protein
VQNGQIDLFSGLVGKCLKIQYEAHFCARFSNTFIIKILINGLVTTEIKGSAKNGIFIVHYLSAGGMKLTNTNTNSTHKDII